MTPRRKSLTPDAPLAPVPAEILDQFVRQGPIAHEELDAAVRRFKKAIIERALGGELTHHLGYPPGGTKPGDTANHPQRDEREDGAGRRWPVSARGAARSGRHVRVALDREARTPFHGRRRQGHRAVRQRPHRPRDTSLLGEMYGVEVSPDLLSTATDAVVAEVTAWQARLLEPMYPVVFFEPCA